MGWSIGYDPDCERDIGYGVPAVCDHPGCEEKIDRGLSHVCGSEPYGGEHGCGLYFCFKHLFFRRSARGGRAVQNCDRCISRKEPFQPKPDTSEWMRHKLRHHSWKQWRDENPGKVQEIRKALRELANAD